MPMQSRRNAIDPLCKPKGQQQESNAGLWFDKYVSGQLKKDEAVGDGGTPQKQLVDEVHCIGVPEAYRHFFNRWQVHLETMDGAIEDGEYRVERRWATAQGRIAIGLGDESVIETAVTLHHTYGVPYVPGSALKGLAATYAHRYLPDEGWRKGGDYHKTLFGTTSTAGYVTFFDALYQPGSGKEGKPLWPDVITVHHKAYYENQADQPPADWDSPTPVPFLTATGTYLIALGGPPDWVNVTFDILSRALRDLGIGAKTSSGYGRMSLEHPEMTVPDSMPADPNTERVEAFIKRVEQLRNTDVAGQIARYVDEWRNLEVSPHLKRRAAQAIVDKIRIAGREKASKGKPWFIEILAVAEPEPTSH